MKFCLSYSGGKDCSLALNRLVAAGHEAVALLVTVNGEAGRSWFHGLSGALLRKASDSLGIPLIESACGADNYNAAFQDALIKAKTMGAVACAFGDIDIEDHRAWDEARCDAVGLAALLPLWQEDRMRVTEEFVQAGFKAYIKAVSKQHGLSADFLGKTLTMDVVQAIAIQGADPCGENGEYHTFCYDGPLFSTPIRTKACGIHENEYAYSLCLEPEDDNL